MRDERRGLSYGLLRSSCAARNFVQDFFAYREYRCLEGKEGAVFEALLQFETLLQKVVSHGIRWGVRRLRAAFPLLQKRRCCA